MSSKCGLKIDPCRRRLAQQALSSLAQLGIKATDYNNGQGISYGSLQAQILEASNYGIHYRTMGAGIRTDGSSGNSEVIFMQIQNEQATYYGLNQLKGQGETIGTEAARLDEHGVTYAWNLPNPNGGQGFQRQSVRAKRICIFRTGRQIIAIKRIAIYPDSLTVRGRNRSINQRKSSLTRLPQAHSIIVKG